MPVNADAWSEFVVFERGHGVAHAKHAIALAHALVDGYAHGTLVRLAKLGHRGREMALVRPELHDIARIQRHFGRHIGEPLFCARNAADENASIVRAAVAHDVIAPLAREVGRGEPAREGLGKTGSLALRRNAACVQHLAVHGNDLEHVIG